MTIARRLAILAAVLLVSGCSLAARPTPRPTVAPVPTLAPDDTPLPTPAPCSGTPAVAAGQGAVELTDFPLEGAYEITDVAWTGTRFVAAGFRSIDDEGYDGPRQALVWTSCDGVDWQSVIDPALQYFTPLTVAPLGDAVYMLGTLSTCGPMYEGQCEDVAEAGNVVMRSDDGASWRRLAQDPEMQTAYDLVLKTIGDRLVAHGSVDDDNLTYSLWQSRDGETWSKTTNLAEMDPIDALVGQGTGMTAFGSLYLDEIEDTTLIVATSADGTSFTAVPAPQLPGATVYDAIPGPGGYAAVGVGYPDTEDFGVQALALHSGDGTTWAAASAADGSFGDAQMDQVHVLPDGSGYVAVGYRLDVDDFTSQLSKVWTSADGTAWNSQLEFGTTFSLYTTSAMGPHGLVAFSADQDESAEEIDTGVSVYFIPTSELAP